MLSGPPGPNPYHLYPPSKRKLGFIIRSVETVPTKPTTHTLTGHSDLQLPPKPTPNPTTQQPDTHTHTQTHTMPPCNYGTSCTRFGCTYQHPRGRPGDCHKALSCTRTDCHFIHPKGHTSGRTLALRNGGGRQLARPGSSGRGGGASATVRIDDGSGRRESLSVTVRRKQLCFVAGVDASGSMAGSRTESAITGLGKIVGMMEPDDLYGLFTFATETKNLHHPMPRSKVDWQKDQQHIRSNGGGMTALYDAIVAGVAEMKETRTRRPGQKMVFEHLVITDGGDNSSSTSLEQVREQVAKPGLKDYHLVLIAVGIGSSSTKANMRSICDNGHSSFIEVDDIHALGRVLAEQAVRIKLVLDINNRGHKSRTTAETSPAGLGRTVRDLDRAAGGSSIVGAGMGALQSSFSRLMLGR